MTKWIAVVNKCAVYEGLAMPRNCLNSAEVGKRCRIAPHSDILSLQVQKVIQCCAVKLVVETIDEAGDSGGGDFVHFYRL